MSAYANIPNVQVYKQVVDGAKTFIASAYVTVYANQESYSENRNVVEGIEISFPFSFESTDSLITQAYAQLKDSNKLSNVEDC